MKLTNKLIIDTLKLLGIPVGFQKYSGSDAPFITFHEYIQSGEEFEDDQEMLTGHYIQVDVWSKTDYTELIDNLKSLLSSVGFKRQDEADFYEPDISLYHKGLRFFYLESKEVD